MAASVATILTNSYNYGCINYIIILFVLNYGFFFIQEMQWDTYYIKFVIRKHDDRKVEGKTNNKS